MNAGDHASPNTPNFLRSVINFIFMLACIFGLAWLMRMFIFQPYEIPSSSMEQTIMVGDMVFSEKVSYLFNGPKQGDIVTFRDPGNADRILIKRCIATEGQTVDIDGSGSIKVDGVVQNEPYTNGEPSYPLVSDITYPYTVPVGHIWVMGDNRTNSQDSRFFGSVPVSSVTGRAIAVYWPLDQIGVLK